MLAKKPDPLTKPKIYQIVYSLKWETAVHGCALEQEQAACMSCIINDAVIVILMYVTANCHEYPEGEEMSTQQTTTMTELGT